MKHTPITYAALIWQESGEPYSSRFKDVYFRTGQGREESDYVFLKANQLPERWLNQDIFTIAETGFGTGLNFLLTLNQWNHTKKPGATLHYIAFELYPIRPADLRKIYGLWPELQPLGELLLAHYPPIIEGFHRIHLGDVILTLIWGDVNHMLPVLEASVDAWFLDGFAPRQNPEMWTGTLGEEMARLTASGGTFATFTATGYVRRSLQRAGFEVTKQPGFAEKRDMLTGILPHALEKPRQATIAGQPWFITPHKENRRDVVVIGGGVAGCSIAYSLAKRGCQVTMIERHAALAMEASGNPAGIIMPLIAAAEDVVGQFYLEAYRYAVQHYSQLDGFEWHNCGVLQLSTRDSNRVRYKNAPDHPALIAGIMHAVSASDASALAGVTLRHEGWFFPQGGWLSPLSLCHAWAHAYPAQVKMIYQNEAIDLTYEQGWKVKDAYGNCLAAAPIAIIANASDAAQFSLCKELPLRRVRGQVTYLPATAQSSKLKTILCYEGYMIPAIDNTHYVGATFHPDNTNASVTHADHEENIGMLTPYLPNNAIGNPDITSLMGRVAFRAASPDRRPLIGEVPDITQFYADYGDLSHGKHYKSYPVGSYLPGLYVSVGHGSRGLVSTPIAAELLACKITGETLPLPQPLVNALNPARFMIRKLQKGI